MRVLVFAWHVLSLAGSVLILLISNLQTMNCAFPLITDFEVAYLDHMFAVFSPVLFGPSRSVWSAHSAARTGLLLLLLAHEGLQNSDLVLHCNRICLGKFHIGPCLSTSKWCLASYYCRHVPMTGKVDTLWAWYWLYSYLGNVLNYVKWVSSSVRYFPYVLVLGSIVPLLDSAGTQTFLFVQSIWHFPTWMHCCVFYPSGYTCTGLQIS